jgi:hypothetical protein
MRSFSTPLWIQLAFQKELHAKAQSLRKGAKKTLNIFFAALRKLCAFA